MDMLTIVNFILDITRDCNFECAHCLNENAVKENLNLDVLPKIFKFGVFIQNLEFSGGEVFLNPDIFSKIVDFIINSGVNIAHLTIITNGTYYTEKIEKSLEKMNLYIEKCRLLAFGGKKIATNNIDIELSVDKYHQDEITKIKNTNYALYKEYMNNVHTLIDSKFFSNYRDNEKIYDEGRARKLNVKKYKPYRSKIYYVISKYGNLAILQASTISVNIYGYVKRTKDGSLFSNDLKEIIKNNGIKCINEGDFIEKYQQDLYKIKNPPLSTASKRKK